MIRTTVYSLLVLAMTSPAWPAEGQPKAERRYAPIPWHLVDIWWDLGKDSSFESLSVDVAISEDIPSSVNLYIAPIGLAHLSKIPFYGGVQTQADGHTKKDQGIRTIGPGFLFSMWGSGAWMPFGLPSEASVKARAMRETS
jgi:hypothetical protein